MQRSNVLPAGLILLAVAACGFASAEVIDSLFPGARPDQQDVVEPLFPHISDAEAVIHRKLNEKTAVSFEEMPLSDSLRVIAKTSNIPIILDQDSIEEVGLDADVMVTLEITNTPLGSVLKNLLEPLELTYFIKDDVLKITTNEGCGFLVTGIYPVSDLVTDDIDSWKELVQLVQGEVDGLWEELDGQGGAILMSRGTKSLIVRQSIPAHEDIHQLLTFLRAAKRLGKERIKPAVVPADKKSGLGSDEKAPQKGGGFF